MNKEVTVLDYEKLYNSYYLQVYSYVMTIVKNQHQAEEITQNTFYKAMTAKKAYAGKSSEQTLALQHSKKSGNGRMPKKHKIYRA